MPFVSNNLPNNVLGFSPDQLPTIIVTIVLALIASGAFTSWVQGRQARKNQVPANALEHRKLDFEGLNALASLQQGQIESLQSTVTKLRERMDSQDTERDVERKEEREERERLERVIDVQRTFISQLEDHILKGNPPPPPIRPQGL